MRYRRTGKNRRLNCYSKNIRTNKPSRLAEKKESPVEIMIEELKDTVQKEIKSKEIQKSIDNPEKVICPDLLDFIKNIKKEIHDPEVMQVYDEKLADNIVSLPSNVTLVTLKSLHDNNKSLKKFHYDVLSSNLQEIEPDCFIDKESNVQSIYDSMGIDPDEISSAPL